MKQAHERTRKQTMQDTHVPPSDLIAKIRRLHGSAKRTNQGLALSELHRDLLRRYRALCASHAEVSNKWRSPVREALRFLGGQGDRNLVSLSDYDHQRYGPFLGVSDEGGAASDIRRAAYRTPKAQALSRLAQPLTLGVALDAERLGGVGEVPIGPDEFSQIWTECVSRLLMTTNIGSRANLRLYRRAPVVTIPNGDVATALKTAKIALAAAFKPFLQAPGGPRPLTVCVEFALDADRSLAVQRTLLRSLLKYVQTGGIAASKVQNIALNVRIGWDARGLEAAMRAINLAESVGGISLVTIDGVVSKDADAVISLPGLLNYLPAKLVAQLLSYAQSKKVEVRSINEPDAESVAREIWSALNTARSMGLDLGKYGLFPLSLEECDIVVGLIQSWFIDWSAAPVFYVDQGIISRSRVYVGPDTERGVEEWFRILAKHKVRICLIDTVDKSQGWKILKTDGDPKGIFDSEQVRRLSALGQKLGIRVLWAGGITVPQAYEFGRLGAFGIYVTTAASEEAPITREYKDDPALFAQKRPTLGGVLKVKTILEAGYLSERLGSGSADGASAHEDIRDAIRKAGLDTQALAKVLPRAWQSWWQSRPMQFSLRAIK